MYSEKLHRDPLISFHSACRPHARLSHSCVEVCGSYYLIPPLPLAQIPDLCSSVRFSLLPSPTPLFLLVSASICLFSVSNKSVAHLIIFQLLLIRGKKINAMNHSLESYWKKKRKLLSGRMNGWNTLDFHFTLFTLSAILPTSVLQCYYSGENHHHISV